MEAKAVNINELLSKSKTQFLIPVFQRNYDWEIQQCKQLLSDIINISHEENEVHFIGSIVYIKRGVFLIGKSNKLIVIDGQQRITTLILIYIVIYKIALENKAFDLAQEINETYLTNKFDTEGSKIKLKTTQNDSIALEFLLQDKNILDFNGNSRIIYNYKYFRKEITEDNFQQILKGLEKLEFVEISLEEGKDDPQKIFESLNSTGLDLTEADLIRNYILVDLNYEQQRKIYEEYWKPIEENARNEELNKSLVSEFIRDYLTFKNKKIPKKKKVYYEFKSAFPNLYKSDYESHLTELSKYANYYNKLVNPKNELDSEISIQFQYMNRLDVHVSYPFILRVYDDYNNNIIDKKIFMKVLRTIESYIWRRFIVEAPTAALNNMFANLYESIDINNYIQSLEEDLLTKSRSRRFPKDIDVIQSLEHRDLYNADSKKRQYLLDRLENYENKEKVKIFGNADITIEHIFPQNPDDEWKSDLTEEEYKEIQEKYLHTIANLTLTGYNSNLGNKPFIFKRDEKGGYKDSRFWLNKYLANLEKFGIEELKGRCYILIERFLKIWQIPDITTDDNIGIKNANIFDVDDPTGLKLINVTFSGEELSVENATDLYEKIFSKLFQENPDAFINSNLGEIVEISQNEKDLRSALKIDENYYIEKHLNNSAKFWRIKTALEIFEYEDELFITYSN